MILWFWTSKEMTMEVEETPPPDEAPQEIDKIMDYLTNNEKICFKSQQRGENDLTQKEKTEIATEIYNKSKLSFLVRFGKYLQKNQLDFFRQFTENCDESYEINIVLKEFLESVKKNNIKNRRYEALKQLIQEDSYFSEIEMMKRNPLLYEQLVGQYLTEEEKSQRDKITIDEKITLVKVLMEGIERDDAKIKKKQQENDEDEMMEEEEEEEETDSDRSSSPQPSYSQWGEFEDDRRVKPRKTSTNKRITPQEQLLLKEEFVSSMYQNFLDGKDDDFDYDSVDNNDRYDDTEMKEYDEEDKYFDSEEPETVADAPEEESEDELDIYMSALNQHPAVTQLSKDIQNL